MFGYLFDGLVDDHFRMIKIIFSIRKAKHVERLSLTIISKKKVKICKRNNLLLRKGWILSL